MNYLFEIYSVLESVSIYLLALSVMAIVAIIMNFKLKSKNTLLDELNLASKDKKLVVKKRSKFVEIYNVRPDILYKKKWRGLLEPLGNIFNDSFIDVKIESKKKPVVKLYFDRLPSLVTFDKCPSLKPMEVWAGINQFGKNVILDLQENPSIYLDGKPGSGKTVAIYALIESFLRGIGSRDIHFYVVTTKPSDFVQYKDSEIKMTINDPYSSKPSEVFNSIFEIFDEVSKIEREFQELVNLYPNLNANDKKLEVLRRKGIAKDVKRMFLIFDEAKDYLSVEKKEDKEISQLKQRLINLVWTHIRRTSRYLSIPTIVASQVQNEGDLGIPLKAFHLRFSSNTNEAMSRLICGSSLLTDPSFKNGKYYLNIESTFSIIKIPYV